MPEVEKEKLHGTVHSVIYKNEDTGYSVFRMTLEDSIDQPVTVSGCAPYIAPGEILDVVGKYVNHPVYGRQFRLDEIDRSLPTREEEILLYLSSGVIKGIGPTMASRIVSRFGSDTLNIIEYSSHQLIDIKGITGARAKQIGELFRQQLGVRSLIEFLSQYRLPPQIALKLYKNYGSQGRRIIENNPYLLVNEYYGVRFQEADEMAMKLGIMALEPMRVEAAVLFELEYNLNQGHTYIPRNKLVGVTQRLLNAPADEYEVWENNISEAIDRLIEREEIVLDTFVDEQACYLYRIHRAECNVATTLRMMSGKRLLPPRGITKMVDDLEKEIGIKYAPEQRKAVLMCARSRVMLLTGGPGTGKTTTIRAMLQLFNNMGLKTALAAPTGRAAKRMSELCGQEAATIHRLLDMEYDKETGNFKFVHNSTNPVPYDVVIVDETSMMDISLMECLLQAIPWGCRLVLVGDPDQLPSVGPGNVLSDMIKSDMIDRIELNQVFRQASKSKIIQNAHEVNRGIVPKLVYNSGDDFIFLPISDPEILCQEIVSLCKERIPQKMGISSDRIQVLSPARGMETGTVVLNQILREALNPYSEQKNEIKNGNILFREGDKVMQIRNNYDMVWTKGKEVGLGIYNGDIGVIQEIDPKSGTMQILMDDDKLIEYPTDNLDELELAYALTVHKAQGSEYDVVILSALKGSQKLFNRKVLYTAITRAKTMMIILGSASVIEKMVMNNKVGGRYSGLKYRIMKNAE